MASAFHWRGCAMATRTVPTDQTRRHAVSIDAFWDLRGNFIALHDEWGNTESTSHEQEGCGMHRAPRRLDDFITKTKFMTANGNRNPKLGMEKFRSTFCWKTFKLSHRIWDFFAR
jgi:hypothetical protein